VFAEFENSTIMLAKSGTSLDLPSTEIIENTLQEIIEEQEGHIEEISEEKIEIPPLPPKIEEVKKKGK
jgi:hypothetical protein